MARADRRRAQRTRPAAAARRSDVVIEDTMFFPRLRRHAKWMFLFLALVFGARLRRLRRRRRRDRLRRRHPRRSGWRRASRRSRTPSSACSTTRRTRRRSGTSSTAQQAAGNTDDAIEALQSYVAASAEGHGRAPRARRALPPAGLGRTGARADLPGALRLLRARRHPRHDLPGRRTARSHPTRSRTP